MGFEPFWYHFWRLGIFDVFAWKITFLMWEKNRHQSIVFLVTIFSLQITTIISALNFPNFKLKLIITFDIIAVVNFFDHIWNQHIVLVKIVNYEVNQRGKKISTYPPSLSTWLLNAPLSWVGGACAPKIEVYFTGHKWHEKSEMR